MRYSADFSDRLCTFFGFILFSYCRHLQVIFHSAQLRHDSSWPDRKPWRILPFSRIYCFEGFITVAGCNRIFNARDFLSDLGFFAYFISVVSYVEIHRFQFFLWSENRYQYQCLWHVIWRMIRAVSPFHTIESHESYFLFHWVRPFCSNRFCVENLCSWMLYLYINK